MSTTKKHLTFIYYAKREIAQSMGNNNNNNNNNVDSELQKRLLIS